VPHRFYPFFLLLCIPFGLACAEPVTLELRPELIAASDEVRLDRLADIHGGDALLRSRIGALEVQIDGPPGSTERVTRDDIAALLALRLPEAANGLQWLGPSELCRVRVTGHRVDLELLTRQAQAALEEWLGPRFRDFSVTPVADSQRMSLEAAADEAVILRPFAGPISARTVLWVDLKRPGVGPGRSFPLWFAVEARAEAPVAASDIEAGSRLTAAQVTKSVLDVAALGARPLLTDADVPGSIAIGPIRKGETLTRDRFRHASAVMAGDEVRVRVEDRQLRLEMHAIALESGAAGQRIHVRNTGSGEVLVASVAGPGVVEVAP
jgi:flagella basal body P-ring formation protein FlgA